MVALIIGVTGGSGSGKTSVTRKIMQDLPDQSIVYLEQDAYYRDHSHLTFEDRLAINYDHPLAFDNELLAQHLRLLSQGEGVQMPVYDYKQYVRSQETIQLEAKDIVILEGILILDDPVLRDLMDIKIYVDTDDDIRLARRILRDTQERGRSVESVIQQYIDQVKPMHLQFIEPSKRYADLIVPEGGNNQVAIDVITTTIQAKLKNVK